VVPDGRGFNFGGFFPPPPTGPATHFQVIAPTNAKVGIASSVAVIALDASNHQVTNYTGTVHLTTSDTLAAPVTDYTFTNWDHGKHVFQVTFGAVGSPTVTATDTVTATITGTATATVVAAPVATHYLVVGPSQTYAGQQSSLTVYALDASNHVVPNYTGTVHFTSTDATFALADYAFTADDHGRHTFKVSFGTTGPQSVTATDTTTASITGTSTVTVNAPLTATKFAIFASPVARVGKAFNVFVAAVDDAGHLVPTYTGAVHFASSDTATGVVLPPDYTFTAADNGVKVFSVTLQTQGSQTISLTDNSVTPLTGTATVNVSPLRFFNGLNFGDVGRVFGGLFRHVF